MNRRPKDHGPAVHFGMSMADALDAARALRVEIEVGHRHGEVRLSHAIHPKRMVAHAARKDAPAGAVRWLLEVRELAAAVDTLQRYRPDLLCALVQVATLGEAK